MFYFVVNIVGKNILGPIKIVEFCINFLHVRKWFIILYLLIDPVNKILTTNLLTIKLVVLNILTKCLNNLEARNCSVSSPIYLTI